MFGEMLAHRNSELLLVLASRLLKIELGVLWKSFSFSDLLINFFVVFLVLNFASYLYQKGDH